eukprot:CAMPEP_0167743044 /NCGR_PEP_ID=MMETSP0110_2-20121227/1789_1 /TAXON_ID=629695 /ORGANISM="Gymnochlora sp., Strain CCMP2014" /LENGTH=374 /DNA_ID=CAMNT_0007627355 /DNA_START=108 /DNA_END=1232 /DNA_ORIENTATION=+
MENVGSELKSKGDQLFFKGKYLKAAVMYTRALKVNPTNTTIRSNRAVAFMNCGMISSALLDCEKVLLGNSTHAKSYLRKARIIQLIAMICFDEEGGQKLREKALVAYKAAYHYGLRDGSIYRELRKLEDRIHPPQFKGFLVNYQKGRNCSALFPKPETYGKSSNKSMTFEETNLHKSKDLHNRIPHSSKSLNNPTYNIANISLPNDSQSLINTRNEFMKDMIMMATQNMKENSTNYETQYWLHHPVDEEGHVVTQVQIDGCFESAAFTKECTDYAAQLIKRTKAQIGCTLVYTPKILFPPVWGPIREEFKGMALQFEWDGGRRIIFIPQNVSIMFHDIAESDKQPVRGFEIDALKFKLHSPWSVADIGPGSEKG